MEEWAQWLEAQGAGAWDGPEPIAQLAPEAEHGTLAERCLLSLPLIVTLVFNTQIYSVYTCSSDGILGAAPGAIERGQAFLWQPS